MITYLLWKENVRHNIDMLLRTHNSTYFAIPVNQKYSNFVLNLYSAQIILK